MHHNLQKKVPEKAKPNSPIFRNLFIALVLAGNCPHSGYAQKINWVSTTKTQEWTTIKLPSVKAAIDQKAIININLTDQLQVIDGFGGCFNEIGWEALSSLSPEQRNKILNDLFSKDGANFTLCRVPVGSNDYSFSYYSYDDVPEDFNMRNFNIDRDRYTLIPYIKAAQQLSPALKIWASPWSPPAWMKVNNNYAMSRGGEGLSGSDMDAGKRIANNATAFRMEDRFLAAYARYLSRYVQAYQKQGIEISRLCVQNEIVYQPHWPSCTWRAEDIAFFIGNFLGPQFKADQLQTGIWLGTVNSSDPAYSLMVLSDRSASGYIKGIGMQWDAKRAIKTVHEKFPDMPLMQTESECGNGENNWRSAEYTWSLMLQYLKNGASSYMYWNMVLDDSGRSSWGWKQNMLISINKQTRQVIYNPEFYLMKHLSHFVQPGAHLLRTDGNDHLAFINPDGTVVLMMVNTAETEKPVSVNVGAKNFQLDLKPKSINSITWKP